MLSKSLIAQDGSSRGGVLTRALPRTGSSTAPGPDETLAGDVGSNKFCFDGTWGHDRIADFEHDTDRIDLLA